jgi:hypothetical protein
MNRIVILIVLLTALYPSVVRAQEKSSNSNAPISPTPPSVISPTQETPITPTTIEKPLPETKILREDGITEKEIADLISKLSTDDPFVLDDTRNELIEIGKPAVLLLHKTLETAKPDIRYLICEILGKIRDERSIEILIKLLQDKEEEMVGASVASAAARSLRYFADISVIPYLMQVTTSTDITLRYESVKTLGVLRGYQATSIIRQLITDTAKTSLGYYVNASAVEALGKLKDTQSVKDLISLLKNSDIEEATDKPFVKYVITSLEQITNFHAGTFSRLDDKKKGEVIKKWEEWWEKNKKNYE